MKWIALKEKYPPKPEFDWVLVAVKLVPENTYTIPHIAEWRNDHWSGIHGENIESKYNIKVTHWASMEPNPTLED